MVAKKKAKTARKPKGKSKPVRRRKAKAAKKSKKKSKPARGSKRKTTVSIEPQSLALGISQSDTLTATVNSGSRKNDVPTIIWMSTNSAIASVAGLGNRGVVTGVSVGTTTVLAVIAGEGENATAEIRVAEVRVT